MKKSLLTLGMILVSLTLVSCSTKDKNENTENTTTSTSEKKETATFTGVVSETPSIDEEIVHIMFDHIKAIHDPDDSVDSLNANGVILLAPFDSFDKSLNPEDVVVGNELMFELEIPTVMTFSLPPQVAGNSIKNITKSE